MGKSLVRKVFEKDDTFVCPGGVKRVRVTAIPLYRTKLIATMSATGGTRGFIDSLGAAYMYGRNLDGECGDGSATTKTTPTLVVGGVTWDHISQGRRVCVGVDTSGNAWSFGAGVPCRGNNATSLTPASSPIAVVGTTKWKKIVVKGQSTTGGDEAFGLDYNNNLWHWGWVSTADLDGTFLVPPAGTSSPKLIAGVRKYVDIFASNNTAQFLTADGDIYVADSSGANNASGVAAGVHNASTPVLIVSTAKFDHMIVNTSGGAAIDRQGNVWTWGSGGSSTPVLVIAGRQFRRLYAPNGGLGFDGLPYSFNITTGSQTALIGSLKLRDYMAPDGIDSGNADMIQDAGTSSATVVTIGSGAPVVSDARSQVYDFDVVPGQSYAVGLYSQYASFGGETLPRLTRKVVVEYFA